MHHTLLSLTLPVGLLAAALGVTAPAQAESRFPPPHLAATAQFSAPSTSAAPTQVVCWYFGAQARPQPNLGESVQRAPSVAAGSVPPPWYRAAN